VNSTGTAFCSMKCGMSNGRQQVRTAGPNAISDQLITETKDDQMIATCDGRKTFHSVTSHRRAPRILGE